MNKIVIFKIFFVTQEDKQLWGPLYYMKINQIDTVCYNLVSRLPILFLVKRVLHAVTLVVQQMAG